jgi:L-threonylcarbamoyladenylate synthase
MRNTPNGRRMTAALRATPVPVTAGSLAEAGRLIRAGGLVAFPTETVYGLGANAREGRAVARIYEAKGRPRFNPLIAHVASVDDARGLGVFSAEAEALAGAFWPGPLTLVVRRREDAALSDLLTAGLPTVALRVPAHDIALALIREAGVPIAAPSANISGRVSATRAGHVAADFGAAVDMILDGGPSMAGVESSIVALAGDGPVLLRAGAVAAEDIERVLGRALRRAGSGAGIQAPGMLQSHYAPRALLRLDADAPRPGEAFLAFGPASAAPVGTLNLSPSADLREAAANLFAHLRALDNSGASAIAVMPIPETGLGEAINDRLRRAAAPR